MSIIKGVSSSGAGDGFDNILCNNLTSITYHDIRYLNMLSWEGYPLEILIELSIFNEFSFRLNCNKWCIND